MPLFNDCIHFGVGGGMVIYSGHFGNKMANVNWKYIRHIHIIFFSIVVGTM